MYVSINKDQTIVAPNVKRFCNDGISADVGGSNSYYGVTSNQALAGKANPRTLIRPTIVAPSHELSYWRKNPLSTYSQINTRTLQYPKEAGLSNLNLRNIPSDVSPQGPEVYLQIEGLTNRDYVALQPNVYTSTNVHQPINATNGIANTPQFPNQTVLIDQGDFKLYYDTEIPEGVEDLRENFTSMGSFSNKKYGCDPSLKESFTKEKTYKNQPENNGFCEPDVGYEVLTQPDPTIYNVYDPRVSGYGSDNRSYLDERLGNQKFFYDDVDAIRQPSYITRSKIDSSLTPIGDTYGKLSNGMLSLHQVRPIVERDYLENSLNFRDDLMKSLMRKRNEEMAQIRAAPKYTMRSYR